MRDELKPRGEEVRIETGMLLAPDCGRGGKDFGGDGLYLGAEFVGTYRNKEKWDELGEGRRGKKGAGGNAPFVM